jgi:aromatic-L-amino-acid decarboxylase
MPSLHDEPRSMNDMTYKIDEIRRLEREAACLDPDAAERRRLLETINGYVERFLEEVPVRPAYISTPDMGRALYDSPIAEQGMDLDGILKLFRECVDDVGLSPVSGRFLGYIPPSSLYHGALGDFLAAVTNKYSGDFSTCPGAVRMEHQLLRWMADLLGYPESAGGVLASGGSMAILTAVVTAREAHGLKSGDYHRAVVYLTAHTHHALDKALHIAGMGECVKRRVPMDAAFRMDPGRLEEQVRSDRAAGLMPWMVACSAGSTDLGSIDPLDAVADVAAGQGLWHHVDGAYGGFFILCDSVRDRFAGIGRSDSVVINPHKGLYTPFGLGAVLVRDRAQIYEAHFHTANYMQDTRLSREELSPADVGPELTRHFRALRLWLPLKLLGVAPFRAALGEKLLLTRYAYERIRGLGNVEMGPEPELTIFSFRFIPDNGDADAFNRRLLEALRRDGTVFLSSTIIDGRYMIRFAVLSFRTHIETIDLAVEIIGRFAKELT